MTGDGAATDERSAPAAVQLAQEIRRLRKAADLSHSDVADMIGYTRQYVSMAEKVGKNLPSRDLVTALDNALTANGTLITLRERAKAEQTTLRRNMAVSKSPDGTIVGSTTSAEFATNQQDLHDERHSVKRRSFLTASGAAAFDTAFSSRTRTLQALEIVTSDQADSLGIATDCLNELVSHYAERLTVSPPAEMYNGLLSVRAYAGHLLERPGSPPRRRSDLIIAAGWLSNLLAVATSYMGDHDSALIWCVDAERRSYESSCREIAGWAALARAMIAYYQGWTDRSIEFAIKGQEIAPMGTVAHAKLAAHEMRAHAMLGDSEGMSMAKRRATKAMAGLPSSVSTSGVFSIAPSSDPPYTATSLLLLRQFKQAASATKSVIEAAYPTNTQSHSGQPSSYARTLLILGLAEAGLGNVDAAAAVGRTALDTSRLIWPTLVLAGRLDRTLMRDHQDAPEAVSYHDLYLNLSAHASRELQRPSLAATGKK